MEITGIKDQICDVCHKMWQLGWVAANDGNVSLFIMITYWTILILCDHICKRKDLKEQFYEWDFK